MPDAADPTWIAWLALPAAEGWPRVKDERAAPLSPGGRCRLTLFERVDGGRPHPRLRVSLPAATDPSPPGPLFQPHPPPADAVGFRAALDAALVEHADLLDGRDLADRRGPVGSERCWRASIAGQRKMRFFADARSFLKARCERAVRLR